MHKGKRIEEKGSNTKRQKKTHTQKRNKNTHKTKLFVNEE
jgi:hypothetical protein